MSCESLAKVKYQMNLFLCFFWLFVFLVFGLLFFFFSFLFALGERYANMGAEGCSASATTFQGPGVIGPRML